jgi:DNA polymerase alpha subunit A
VGRLKRSTFPNLSGGGHTFGGGAGAGLLTALAGRLLCDTYLGARELLREVDYTMTTLAHVYLNETRCDLAASDVPGELAARSGSWPHCPAVCGRRSRCLHMFGARMLHS